jgi:hypothetical protein
LAPVGRRLTRSRPCSSDVPLGKWVALNRHRLFDLTLKT